MSAAPQLINAREVDVYGWSAMAFSLDNDNETTIGVGFGPTREAAVDEAKTEWFREHDRREREAVVAALAGDDERPRRRKR